MPKLTIDGVEIEARDGQTVLQTALEHGFHIPHLCFHPRLKIAGNCRMCLVEIEKVPKLQIACGTEVREGMVLRTKSDKVVRARKAVLEFLLINHPLDCPICDQCGECKLQDYCFQYGQEQSRYQETKRTYPKKIDLGANIVRDMNRCIHCTRCIRFLRDVAGLEEFTLYERGGRTQVGPYLNSSIQTSFSLNLSEVCPVGALTSKHFRFKARSWLMRKVRTLCAVCSRGCNIFAWEYKGKISRLTPAENDMVNLSWLCDAGRFCIHEKHAVNRVTVPAIEGREVSLDQALEETASRLKSHIGGEADSKIGVIVSTRLTNEDLYLIRKLSREVLSTEKIAWLPGPKDEKPFGPMDAPLTEWFVRKDKTPNSRGAEDILGSPEHESSFESLLESIEGGETKILLVFSEDPARMMEPLMAERLLDGLDFLLVVDSRDTKTMRPAKVVIPEKDYFEKDGTFTNEAGRVQRLRAVIDPGVSVRSAWQTAQDIAKLLGVRWCYASSAEVMEEIAAKVPNYAQFTYSDLDDGEKVFKQD